MKFWFGSIVVVDWNLVWIVVKSRESGLYDVYVRSYNWIKQYKESDLMRFIYDKELSDESLEFYK